MKTTKAPFFTGLIDVLIALTAMENRLMLLHHDRDFDAVASVTPGLKILTALQ